MYFWENTWVKSQRSQSWAWRKTTSPIFTCGPRLRWIRCTVILVIWSWWWCWRQRRWWRWWGWQWWWSWTDWFDTSSHPRPLIFRKCWKWAVNENIWSESEIFGPNKIRQHCRLSISWLSLTNTESETSRLIYIEHAKIIQKMEILLKCEAWNLNLALK